MEDEGVDSEEKERIIVVPTENQNGRTYDKRHFCMFCNKSQAKLPRHLISTCIHRNEIQVATYMAEDDKDINLKMLTRMRNIGIHRHNSDVIREGKEIFLVAYRPSKDNS